jgi:hypothetical protein
LVLSDIAGSCSTPLLPYVLTRTRTRRYPLHHPCTGYYSESHPLIVEAVGERRYLTVMFCDLVYSV